MRFKHGTDMDVAYREVRDRIERAQFAGRMVNRQRVSGGQTFRRRRVEVFCREQIQEFRGDRLPRISE